MRALTLILFGSVASYAGDPLLLATMGNKASISFGDKPVTLAVGETRQGVKLVSVEMDSAVLESGGKRRNVKLGQAFFAPGSNEAGNAGSQSATLYAVSGGHFLAQLSTRSGGVRGLIDTGASYLSLSSPQAAALGVTVDRNHPLPMHTAQGISPGWTTHIDELKLEGLTLYNVEAVVMAGNYPEIPLIGMSVLNMLNMQRDGDHMTLKKKF